MLKPKEGITYAKPPGSVTERLAPKNPMNGFKNVNPVSKSMSMNYSHENFNNDFQPPLVLSANKGASSTSPFFGPL